MKIQSLAPLSIIHTTIKITEYTSNKAIFTLTASGNIREIDTNLNFVITIFVDVEICEKGKKIFIQTENK